MAALVYLTTVPVSGQGKTLAFSRVVNPSEKSRLIESMIGIFLWIAAFDIRKSSCKNCAGSLIISVSLTNRRS